MTKRRDPDIMAMDHVMRAIKRSTPRMLRANIDFVIFLLQKLWVKNEAQRRTLKHGEEDITDEG